MLDGTHLRQSWYDALDNAQSYFRQLLTSHSSNDWKRVNVEGSQSSVKGKARASNGPHLTDVVLHRKIEKGTSVYRAVLDVPGTEDGALPLDACKTVLVTPELRKEWDPAVEQSQLLEMFDQATRICKTNFTLGWPASPRDAVTISRTFNDATTLIDISTSLPRSPDEPVYLRPSPPYVRSEVGLFAWCIQLVTPVGGSSRLRITCFWQHDLRSMWTGGFGSATSMGQQLASMMVGFLKTVKTKGATRVPVLTGYGHCVSVERVRFQIDREALTVDYAIVPEDSEEDHRHHESEGREHGLEELHAIREHRRLTRAVEWSLSAGEGWDVQITTKASSEDVAQLPWTAHATRSHTSSSKEQDKVILNVKHSELPNSHAVLKVRVTIELSGPSSGWRLNGIPQPIEDVEERDLSSHFMSQPLLQDSTSMAGLSFHTRSTANTQTTIASTSTIPEAISRTSTTAERAPAAERSILSRIKRNYIYFSSLLQEPEAKWKRATEARGVSISQLDSIDPTLVVFRAEATFVGLSLWDLYAAIATPGARAYWDRLYDDSVLLEDVNQLTELWHYKTKPAWPVNGRDSVVLKTVYKSPTTIHVFAFSADDPNLFPNIPPAEPNVIRTQVDLQGWAIEALSPTTTLVTLLEQSDPKGWSNKASIPQQMISAVAGVGDFVIKCGGPPVVTRLEGARANDIRYDHEKGSFRIEYEGCASRRESSGGRGGDEPVTLNPVIECELRCDLDTWASSLDIVIDPPPQSTTVLRRHKLSAGGGGLWLTVNHDAVHASDERLQAIVRRAPQGVAKDKGLVMVNGAKVDVDVEELLDREVKTLAKQKRIKPARIPLDQPPVLGVIRRRRAEWDSNEQDGNTSDTNSTSSPIAAPGEVKTTAPAMASALTRYWSYAVEQATVTTQQAVAAISPANASGTDAVPSSSKPPMQYALEALSYVQGLYAQGSTDGWTPLGDKVFSVYRKIEPEISSVISVHRGEKVIEGMSADELASVLTSYECRKQWDTRFDSYHLLESFGAESHAAFVVTKGGFPFRDRGFYLANVMARTTLARKSAGESEHVGDGRTTVFLVAASFSPESAQSFSQGKYNPYTLPIGRVFVDGWILETLDPYGSENYAIPSTRCTRVVAVDYAGSIPAAVNSSINAMLPRSVLALETYLKSTSPVPFTRLPAAGLMISSKSENPIIENSWTLRKRDAMRTMVTTKYMPTERTYYSTILLNIAPPPPGSPAPDRTPRPSQFTSRTPASRKEDKSPSPGEEATTPTSPVKATSPSSSRFSDAVRSSSMFTTRGEVRHPTDLMVGELVVDTKLYPDGYAVRLMARIDKGRARLSLPASVADLPPDNPLPISTAVYTLPPSPLLSSGLNTDRPPCHLLRLTLPTAQYQMSTIQDPLTGETRSAPPRPQWLLDLEEGRAVIVVEIRPGASPTSGEKGEDRKAAAALSVDGNSVSVLSEKESLTILGRDELLDGRTAKMDLLIRCSSEEQLPQELQCPIAIATHLLDDSASATSDATPSDSADGEGPDTPAAASPVADEKKLPPDAARLNEGTPADSAASGLLRFLNSYPNPLTRFAAPGGRAGPILRTLSGSTVASLRASSGPGRDGAEATGNDTTTSGDGGGGGVQNGVRQQHQHQHQQRQEGASLTPRADTAPSYPLSTVIIVALIAFLIGSLLRSMLSPADFVYVVSDLRDVELRPVDGTASWRELKRLFELKYLVGGWDFQVALVRRH